MHRTERGEAWGRAREGEERGAAAGPPPPRAARGEEERVRGREREGVKVHLGPSN